jgi:hypothetical protein
MMGAPQWGQLWAVVDTVFPHSIHFTSDMTSYVLVLQFVGIILSRFISPAGAA